MTRSERFKQARLNTGLTQTQVEMKTGLSRTTLEKAESAQLEHLDFRFDSVYRLAKLYGVDPVWLMEGDEDEG